MTETIPWSDLVGLVLAFAGTLVMTLGVVGIVRAPDVRVQIHACSTLTVIGLPLVLAAGLATGVLDLVARMLVVAVFALVTAPLTTHALARLARRTRGSDEDDPGRFVESLDRADPPR